jgi:hypothetical protein
MKRLALVPVLLVAFISVSSGSDDAFVQVKKANALSAAQIAELKRKALSGETEAALLLGIAYDGGNRWVSRDRVESDRWYDIALSNGSLDAQYWKLGRKLGQADSVVALRNSYLKLAEEGNIPSMNMVAMMCSEGQGGIADNGCAFEWWKKTSELGSVEGEFNLALMYLNGEGISKDEAKGIDLLRKAADGGFPAAASRIAPMALMSQAGLKPTADVRKWLLTASDAGDELAMFNLGMAYFHEIGGTADYVEAYKWFTLALEWDRNKQIIDGRIGLKPKMTAAQISEAERGAKQWDIEHGRAQ